MPLCSEGKENTQQLDSCSVGGEEGEVKGSQKEQKKETRALLGGGGGVCAPASPQHWPQVPQVPQTDPPFPSLLPYDSHQRNNVACHWL